MYRRILAAIDITPSEGAVLQETRELARVTGATVYLLHVVLDNLMPGDPIAGVPADELAEVEKALAQLRNAGVAAEGELVNAPEHDISAVILQRAKDLDVQLIVLGETLHRIRYRMGWAGYPTLRLMTLVETGTRGLVGAVLGSAADRDEASLARRLLPLLRPGMLVLAREGRSRSWRWTVPVVSRTSSTSSNGKLLGQLPKMTGCVDALGDGDDMRTGDSGRLRHDGTSGIGEDREGLTRSTSGPVFSSSDTPSRIRDSATKRLTSRHWIA